MEDASRRVLIVDDDIDFAETLVDIVSIRGIEVACAHSVSDVQEKLNTTAFPVVLLDIRLGRESGLDLLGFLKERYPNTICVMMTAYGDIETAVRALKQGAYDYFKKPVNGTELLATLERCFERIALEAGKYLAEEALRERNEELAKVNSRLKGILNSAAILTACTDYHHMRTLLLEEYVGNLNGDAGALYEVNTQRLHLLHTLQWDSAPPTIEQVPSAEDPVVGAIQSGSPVLLPDVGNGPTDAWWRVGSTGSLLIIPLVQYDGRVGLLAMLYRFSTTPFSQQDREFGLVLASMGSKIDRALRTTRLLQESEEQFRSLVANLPGAVYRCQNDSRLVMEFISSAIEDISGYKPSDFYAGGGITYRELVHPDDHDLVQRSVDAGVRAKTPFVIEYRLVDRSGEIHWVYEKGNALYDEDGAVRSLDGAIFDITDTKRGEETQRQLERQMHQVQKMESLGVLAGGIAHDFNNLLMPIIGNAEMLEGDVDAADPIHDSIAEIHQAGLRAKDLVYQILSFSRQVDTKPGIVNVVEIVAEALRLMRASLPVMIDVVEEIGDKKLLVMADASQLHQIVMNLCTNAFHAMEKRGGTLSVSLGVAPLSQEESESHPGLVVGHRYVRISIRDTGIGMSPEVQEHIFEPFFTTKDAGKGTGIGLATVHTIVGDFHGSITVHSEEGVGTEFLVLLSQHQEKVDGGVPTNDEVPCGSGEHILIVDDELGVLQVAEAMTRSLGYKPNVFSTGAEALEQFQKDPDRYAMLITDQAMPGMTGDQLVKEVKRLSRSIPVVMASGYSYTLDREAVENADTMAFVQKPFTRIELAEAMRRVMNAAAAEG